ncbi:MAG: PKD domain-containing protein, partial [Thermoplasmata archaeon]|nr:PKD domain-containing protein [Thermoplasmata archaeon]
GGRASTWEHALLLKVISIATMDAPNLWRDQYDIITYVRGTQLPDGSFDDKNTLPNQDGPSETKHAVMVTALYDLGRPKEGRQLADWVISQQDPDGSFDCPHDKDTIGDTAMAALGVLPIGNVTSGGDALKWLIGQQRPDGSWNAITGLDIVTSRILSTQWVMLAVHAGLTNYNLALDGSTITADAIWEGDPARVMGFTINLTVKNQGLVGVTGATVKIFDGPRENRLLANLSPIDVPALGDAFASLAFRSDTRGPHEVHVWVDYADGGEYRNRDNNASIQVNLNREPTGIIRTPLRDQLFGFGEPITFKAVDIVDLDNDVVTLTWTDDVTGFMSHEDNFSMVLTPGDHHVILTFEDGNGPSTRANVSFSVRQNIPPTVRISVPADGARYFDYQTVVFDASASSDAEGHHLTYTWVSDKAGVLGYGDKISQKLGPGVHVITVWVDDSWANVTKNVTIRILETFPPTVVIASPAHGQIYVTTTRVSFDANGTFDTDSDILEYFWTSNINGLLSERPQFLTKLSVGHHFITLSVDDGNYNVSKTIEIDVSDNRAPMAIISSPEHEASYYSLDLIELNASGSYDLEDPLTYFWVSSREGTLGNEPIITLNLARGEHTITLWVNDGHGHNISTSIEVTILNLGPTAGISSPEPGTVFTTAIPVQFMSATSFDPEGDKLTYEWFLRPSDGEWTQIGTTARLERTFKTPGHYDVKLVASDDKETDEITSTFQVKMSDEVDGGEDDLLSNPVFLGAIGLGIIIALVAVFFLLKARD